MPPLPPPPFRLSKNGRHIQDESCDPESSLTTHSSSPNCSFTGGDVPLTPATNPVPEISSVIVVASRGSPETRCHSTQQRRKWNPRAPDPGSNNTQAHALNNRCRRRGLRVRMFYCLLLVGLRFQSLRIGPFGCLFKLVEVFGLTFKYVICVRQNVKYQNYFQLL